MSHTFSRGRRTRRNFGRIATVLAAPGTQFARVTNAYATKDEAA